MTVGNAAVELIDQGADLIIAPCDFDFGGPASREAQTRGHRRHLDLRVRPALFVVVARRQAVHALDVEHHDGRDRRRLRLQGEGLEDSLRRHRPVHRLHEVAVEVLRRALQGTIGGEIILEDTYTNGDNDFSAQLARLQALGKKPDVIFISSYGQDIGAIIRALREVGYDAPVLGGDSYDDPALHAALGESLGNDVFFVTHTFMTPEAHPDMEKFIDLYTEMHGARARHGLRRHRLGHGDDDGRGGEGGRHRPTARPSPRRWRTGKFKLLTGDLTTAPPRRAMCPNKAAVMVELKGGKPTFLGWRRPETLPAP